MKKWSILLMIAVVALLMPVFAGNVNAEEGASLSISKSAAPTSASVGDTITYTYTITNTGSVAISAITMKDSNLALGDQGQISLSKTALGANENVTATATYTIEEKDLPGPLVNTATVSGTDPDGNPVTANASVTVKLTYAASIQVTKTANKTTASPHETITYTYEITNNGNVTISNITLQDDKLGAISLSNTTLASGAKGTATATYTVTITDLPGPIINTATVTGTDSTGKSVSAKSEPPVSVSLTINKALLTKAEILKLSGVPGKGIATAPGLQKPFNPKSQAAYHAGKKDRNGEKNSSE